MSEHFTPSDLLKLEVVIGLNAGEFTTGADSVRSLAKVLYEANVRVVDRD